MFSGASEGVDLEIVVFCVSLVIWGFLGYHFIYESRPFRRTKSNPAEGS